MYGNFSIKVIKKDAVKYQIESGTALTIYGFLNGIISGLEENN